MQTVYSHTLFGSSPVTISAIDFFLSGTSGQTYSITVSTSANPVGSLSSTYSNNLGADATLFYSGAISTSAYPGAWTSFGGSFLYDPSMGDLLVQITHSGGEVLSSSYEGSTVDAQRVYDFGSGSTTGFVNSPGYAITTRFTLGAAVGAVPEPSTWAMMLLGFGAIGLASRRNRRRALARA